MAFFVDMFPFVFLLVLLMPLTSHGASRKCATGPDSWLVTEAKRCPKGSAVIKDPTATRQQASPANNSRQESETDCTILRQRAEAIDFRLRRSRTFPEDKKNWQNLQARLRERGC